MSAGSPLPAAQCQLQDSMRHLGLVLGCLWPSFLCQNKSPKILQGFSNRSIQQFSTCPVILADSSHIAV